MKTDTELADLIGTELKKTEKHLSKLHNLLHVAQLRLRAQGVIDTPVAPMSGGTGGDKPDPEEP